MQHNQYCNGHLTAYFLRCRSSRPLSPERRNDEIASRSMKLLNRTLGAAETHMQGRVFLAGEFTVADTITGHAIIMSRRLGADFSECPNLSAYAEALEARETFKKAESA